MPDVAIVALRDLVASVVPGFWGSDDQGFGTVPARVIRNGDAARGGSRLAADSLPLRWLTRQEVERARTTPNDTILVSSGEVGRVARLVDAPDDVVVSNFVRRVRPATRVDASWLFHLMDSPRARVAARAASGGTALENLSWRFYGGLRVVRPDHQEQQRIGEILDSIDAEAKLTDALIGKLLRMRAGLLVDLLTRGLNVDGGLRPAALQGTAPYRDTELGPLPASWRVLPVSALLARVQPATRSGPFGSALLKHELVASGIPLLGIDNVHVDRFVDEYTRFVTLSKANQLARYRVRPSDVMITIMGTVGRTCVVPPDIGHALSSKHVWTLTFDQNQYLPYLASLQLNHAPWAKAQLRADEQGGIMSAIRSDTLRTLLLPVPPIEEQRRIADVLRESDRRIALEKERLRKLELIRLGLLAEFYPEPASVGKERH